MNMEAEAMSPRVKRRAEMKAKVISDSLGLFLDQGYDETTMRQILAKTGLLNGSLYNIFKGKDEIFSAVMTEAVRESVAEAEKYLGEDADDESRLSFPLILVIYSSSESKKVAGLLSVIGRKWDVKNKMADLVMEWVAKGPCPDKFSYEEARTRVLACIGAMGGIVETYEKGCAMPLEDSVDTVIGMIFFLFRIDNSGMKERNRYILSLIKNNDIEICGVHI